MQRGQRLLESSSERGLWQWEQVLVEDLFILTLSLPRLCVCYGVVRSFFELEQSAS